MATLTKNLLANTGEQLAFTAAAASDQVAYEDDLYLVAWNDGGAASKTVTIVSQFGGDVGTAAANNQVAVAIDAVALIPLGDSVYRDSSDFVQIQVDVAANMKYAVVEIRS